MSNIDMTITMRAGNVIHINFTQEATTSILEDFANFDSNSKDAGKQSIQVRGAGGKLVAVVRLADIAAITT